jgi:WD40 repeat protein
VAFDGATIVSGSIDDRIKVWDVHTGECKKTLRGHTVGVLSVAFDGTTIVSGSYDRTVKVWDVHTG